MLLGPNNNDINRYLNDNITKEGDFINYKRYQFKHLLFSRILFKGLKKEYSVIKSLRRNSRIPSILKDYKVLALINKEDQ